MRPDYDSLAEAVREWAARAGIHIDGVHLTDGDKDVVVLPLGGTDEQPPPAEERGRPISQVVVDIMEVMEATKKPLTQYGVLTALAKAGKEWSQRSVAGHLAEMVRDGVLVNPEGARPAGYRLPE